MKIDIEFLEKSRDSHFRSAVRNFIENKIVESIYNRSYFTDIRISELREISLFDAGQYTLDYSEYSNNIIEQVINELRNNENFKLSCYRKNPHSNVKTLVSDVILPIHLIEKFNIEITRKSQT